MLPENLRPTFTEDDLADMLKDAKVYNGDAISNEDIIQYYITSTKLMNVCMHENKGLIYLEAIDLYETHAIAKFEYQNEIWYSIYIKANHRGRGVYLEALSQIPEKDRRILTTEKCDIEGFLQDIDVSYDVACSLLDYEQAVFPIIWEIYGDKRTKRSGVPYINHIIEGLITLECLKLHDDMTEAAFCLHPVFQNSDSAEANQFARDFKEQEWAVNFGCILYSHLYALTANSLLLTDFKNGKRTVGTGIHDEVIRRSLIADKIQNRKDFELYHKGDHKDSKELDAYFKHWFKILDVTEDQFNTVVNVLIKTVQFELNYM